MSQEKTERLDSVMLSDTSDSSEILKNIVHSKQDKYLICCFTYKWCFKHQGLSAYKIYDVDDCLCFRCLDWCTWCLEFKQKKNGLCKYKTICFICCCSITFQ
jgi:hypothetical protein